MEKFTRPSLDAIKGPRLDKIKRITSTVPTKKALTLFGEFKAFALKGNVIDLAIGVVIGGAFGKLVDSLVKNLLMPLLGVLTPGEHGYQGWSWTIEGKTIPFGLFLGDTVNFLIVAFALFVFVRKFLSFVLRVKKEKSAAPPPLTKDQQLLSEIRDLLLKTQQVPSQPLA